MLKERIKTFLELTGAPMTKFCSKAGISPTAMYRYLSDDLRLSVETEDRIKCYLDMLKLI
ncbi:MAG: hypothetical protein E7441_00890 [Ruminococcaceae bacterium]|nr:hypothetical protein [Oscillospiraceae bacterium]